MLYVKDYNMKEELLHAVWKFKRFDFNNLQTTSGEKISILNFGIHNFDAGPDFLNGTIKINDTTWVGHIEMHVTSSDWLKHKHQYDPAYNNVILHVVFQHDRHVKTESGQTIPTLVLENRIEPHLIQNYQNLLLNSDWVPCASLFHKFNSFKLSLYLERLLVERLEEKSHIIVQTLNDTKNDWEFLCYKLVMKYLGLKVNGEAFGALSNKVSYQLLSKNVTSLFRAEALLLGQAGLLHNIKDSYSKDLKVEYSYLKHKYKLKPMSGVEWRFARMRPSNFPTIRIAQLAALYFKTNKLFNQIVENPELKNFNSLLNVQTSEYWNTHYIPGKKAKFLPKIIGSQTCNLLIINAFIPLIFSYAKITGNDALREVALNLYRQLPKEKNVIITNWAQLGVEINSSAETQALIQLKMQYCNLNNCLRCQIGQEILFK